MLQIENVQSWDELIAYYANKIAGSYSHEEKWILSLMFMPQFCKVGDEGSQTVGKESDSHKDEAVKCEIPLIVEHGHMWIFCCTKIANKI